MALAAIGATVTGAASLVSSVSSLFGGGGGGSGNCPGGPDPRAVDYAMQTATRRFDPLVTQLKQAWARANGTRPFPTDPREIADIAMGGDSCKIAEGAEREQANALLAILRKYPYVETATGTATILGSPAPNVYVDVPANDTPSFWDRVGNIGENMIDSAGNVVQAAGEGAIRGATGASQGARVGSSLGGEQLNIIILVVGVLLAVLLFKK